MNETFRGPHDSDDRDLPARPRDPRDFESDRRDTERFATERFDTEHLDTERFATERFETRPPERQPYPPQSSDTQRRPQYPPQQHNPQPYQGHGYHPQAPGPQGYRPLAHEGGFAYGNPPAPPLQYGPQDQFIPAHLQVPNPYAPPMYQQPFMHPQQMPPMQQTVYVNGGTKRVNHVLHLILTLLTAGLWLPIWIILALANS